ncbi:DUF1302 domain-containing protein [Endozoicomonas numazuensis]|uniref:Glycine/betaine transmethylase n=1 Tax=Endozoicomonas numazuensis TaxID=1137799 RepID=A0A081NGD0_9GAMM|nr:DUF1302 domain-containing protein [Endozoicomonas numazuensis]KEQ17503.1 hypothetical protein GZ78_17230 [Endozoicomonas numazuensis]
MAIAQSHSIRLAAWRSGFALAGSLSLAFSVSVHAAEFASEDGNITGALDTAVSYGAMWRVEGRDNTRYRGSSTPNHDDVNLNDGNRAFDKGLVSQVIKVSADLEIDWQEQYGVFIRGTAFYDSVLMDTHNDWNSVNRDAVVAGFPEQTGTHPYGNDWANDVKKGQGRDAKIQDAYFYGAWNVGEMPLDIRVGKQAMNWGEGLFYRDGINTINALDGASYALPGSEVKDLLIPQNAVSFSLGITENLSMSAFYQFQWEETVLPGRGTYFSTNDLFVEGGSKGYNEIPSDLSSVSGLYALANSGASLYQDMGIKTAGDYIVVADTSGKIEADDNGQWGFNFKYFAEELNDTEFGFYFVNYNSHVPYIQAQLDRSSVNQALATVSQASSQLKIANTLAQTIPSVGVSLETALISEKKCLDTVSCAQYLAGQAAGAAVLSNGVSATRVFPEDIQMYGVSFNTAFGSTSIAGELAYRPNAPMWIDHPDDLVDGFKDNLPAILAGADCFTNFSQAHPGQEYCLSSGAYKNYDEIKLWTGSLVFVENFGPRIGFDGLYGILEPSFEYIQNLDDYDTFVSTASGAYGASFASDYTPSRDRLDKFSWGFTAVLSGELNDVFAGINLNPYVIYKHDVSGNSRRTGNFLAGRKAFTLGVKGLYLNAFEAGLAYTTFYGSERTNAINDRDNVAFNMKYSF